MIFHATYGSSEHFKNNQKIRACLNHSALVVESGTDYKKSKENLTDIDHSLVEWLDIWIWLLFEMNFEHKNAT